MYINTNKNKNIIYIVLSANGEKLQLIEFIKNNNLLDDLDNNIKIILKQSSPLYMTNTIFMLDNEIWISVKMKNLNVLSLNISYSTMSNKISGSESEFVRLCQNNYIKYRGLAYKNKNISQCTSNATNLLKLYDIFGIQEYNINYANEFENIMSNYKFIRGRENAVGYNQSILGIPIIIKDINHIGPVGNQRGMQAIWFDLHKLIFVNLHAPHDIDIMFELQYQLNKLSKILLKMKINPDRIIITGDFNDYKGSLIGKTIKFIDFNLHVSNNIRTCCFDTNYTYAGDYIIDSNNNTYFDYPEGYKRNKPPISDHDPIALYYDK